MYIIPYTLQVYFSKVVQEFSKADILPPRVVVTACGKEDAVAEDVPRSAASAPT